MIKKAMLFLGVLIICFFMMIDKQVCYAETLTPESYIKEIIKIQPEYNSWEDGTLQFSVDLYGDDINYKIYDVLSADETKLGYHRISSDYYVCVMDGHSDKTVMKVWTKYNDYMCTLKLK